MKKGVLTLVRFATCVTAAFAVMSSFSALAQPSIVQSQNSGEKKPTAQEQAKADAARDKLKKPIIEEGTKPQRLDEVVVKAEAQYQGIVQAPFLAPVEGTQIYSGKKNNVIDLDAFPEVQANNYRHALAMTPGLLISEESSPLVSLGYRGIGEPHRGQFMQVLKDGIPIHADPFGYPEAYYTPPLDVVDRIEFLRGGAGLMYGPQPAGALNYVTYMPRMDKAFGARSQHVFGSDGLYSTYNSVDGTVDRVGYLAYYNHRQSDGFREANSDYQLDGGHFKIVIDGQTNTRWILGFDAYEETHGEPGGLTLADFANNPEKTTRFNDHFELRRYVPSLTFEHDFSEDTLLSVKSWGGYYDRRSWRQRGGGFGTLPTGGTANSNQIERQEFYTFGFEPRLRHDWEAWDNKHTLAGGFQVYTADSPRTDKLGASATALDGLLTSETQRDSVYGSFFLENRFVFDKFSITPGFRLENIYQEIGTQNFDSTTGLPTTSGKNDKLDVKPLVALGLAYQATADSEIYANVSEAYRTTIFTQSLVVPASGTFVDGDIDPTVTWTYETGYRGKHEDWLHWDTSLFLVDLDNKFGSTVTVGSEVRLGNVGRSINYGWDAALELDTVRLYDALNKTQYADQYGSVSLYANVMLMEAEIHGGSANGRNPQYAPNYITRGGLIYRWQDRVKVGFLGTFVGQHNATDTDSANFRIPAYMVWDLTAEVKVYKDYVSLMAGLNNVFDESYYSRVRSDGIDPGYGRNFYAGFSVQY